MAKRHIARTPKHKKSTRHCTTKLIHDQPSTTKFDTPVVGVAGQHFHMDFGFVRGSGYRLKTDDNKTVTSIDGYNSYLIIVDRVTRYMWTFLTSSKSPPINLVQRVLRAFNPHIYIKWFVQIKERS